MCLISSMAWRRSIAGRGTGRAPAAAQVLLLHAKLSVFYVLKEIGTSLIVEMSFFFFAAVIVLLSSQSSVLICAHISSRSAPRGHSGTDGLSIREPACCF